MLRLYRAGRGCATQYKNWLARGRGGGRESREEGAEHLGSNRSLIQPWSQTKCIRLWCVCKDHGYSNQLPRTIKESYTVQRVNKRHFKIAQRVNGDAAAARMLVESVSVTQSKSPSLARLRRARSVPAAACP